jgi:hypothetical protein
MLLSNGGNSRQRQIVEATMRRALHKNHIYNSQVQLQAKSFNRFNVTCRAFAVEAISLIASASTISRIDTRGLLK